MLALLAIVLTATSLEFPAAFGDQNTFFKDFVNQEFLATLGIIVTITLASAASLHLELNKLEDQTGRAFSRTRASIKKSAYSLLVVFAVGVVLVVAKPMLPANSAGVRLINASAVLILYFNLSVLYAITRTVFAIPTVTHIQSRGADGKE